MHGRQELVAGRWAVGAALLLGGSLSGPAECAAQTTIPIREFAPVNISRAISRSTLRTIQHLPPVSNVGYSFKYDPQLDTYVRARTGLVSGMVPAARFNPQGTVSGIVSFAYFDLDEFRGEDSSTVVVDTPSDVFNPASPPLTIGISSRVRTEVYVVRLAGRYSILDNLDAGFAIPLITTKTSSRYVAQVLQGDAEVARFVDQGVNTPEVLGNELFDGSLDQIDFPGGFREGTNFDVGNVVIDAKVGVPMPTDAVALGAQVEVRLPTGNEDRFTGTDTTGLRGLLLASYQQEYFGAYFAGGYEYDFSTNQLSNGAVSASLTGSPYERLMLEAGVNANFYVDDVDLYDSEKFDVAVPGTVLIAGEPTLGKNEVNVGGGMRYNLVGDAVLGIYATTPVTDDGYHASWIASASLDVPF
jgi:hypothetical protein